MITVTILLCAFSSVGKAQSGFTVKFNSPLNEGGGNFLENLNGEFVGYLSKLIPQTNIADHYLYKISINGDTLLNRKFLHKQDTLRHFCSIIQSNDNPAEYLISGYGTVETMRNNFVFDFFIKVDSGFNAIWEKTYYLCPPDIYPIFENSQRLLKKNNSGYVFATLYDFAGNNRLVFFEMAENGDSLAYRAYAGDSAGSALYDLYYNHDSTAYLVNVYDTHPVPFWGERQILTIDFDFNQTEVTYLPRWHKAITSKLLPDGSIVSGGIYEGFVYNPYQQIKQICALKYDTSLVLTDSSYFTNPDDEIRKREGYYNSIDYHYPNSIFVAGTYDEGVGVWITHPSWIAIAKYDSDLNLLTEKYIGGDAYYLMFNIVATSDGGALITTSRFDYQTQYYEHDFYVIKLDSLDLLVGDYEHKSNDLVKNAIVYPNPALDKVFVRTAVKDAEFIIYDLNGTEIKTIKQNIRNLITPINISVLPKGNYIWCITKNRNRIETGRLVKTK